VVESALITVNAVYFVPGSTALVTAGFTNLERNRGGTIPHSFHVLAVRWAWAVGGLTEFPARRRRTGETLSVRQCHP
jgi:hypothetical protein